jgi:hypothetical protein
MFNHLQHQVLSQFHLVYHQLKFLLLEVEAQVEDGKVITPTTVQQVVETVEVVLED